MVAAWWSGCRRGFVAAAAPAVVAVRRMVVMVFGEFVVSVLALALKFAGRCGVLACSLLCIVGMLQCPWLTLCRCGGGCGGCEPVLCRLHVAVCGQWRGCVCACRCTLIDRVR